MNIMAIANGTDTMGVLTNQVSRLNQNRQQAGANGQDFSTVIDATALSIMAGATIQPVSVTGQVSLPVGSDNRTYTTVETTARAMSTRGNDYTQQTQMAERGNTTQGMEARTGEGFSEGLQTAVDTAGGQMAQQAAETLNVPVEEVEDAIFSLGLTQADLLTDEGITDLVMEVTGEDETALLTDSVLYEDLRTLIDTAQDLKVDVAQEFAMTTESLDEAIETMTQVPEEEAVTMPEEAVLLTEEAAPVVREETVIREEARTERTREQADDQPQTIEQNAAQTPAAEKPEVQTQQQTGQQTQSGSRNAEGSRQTEAAIGNAQAVANAERFLNGVNEALASTVSYAGSTQTVDAQDVMRQVLDYMRASAREGMTELEMQLNPQSLGRVHVTLQAMDSGEMIARFTTQNDQVREALANQMPELLQRFEEQGIKVNEVEVAVAQQGFNEQRDENRAREDRDAEQEAAIARMGRMQRVRIDLQNMSEEEIASLDDDQRIEAEMMAAEGNTVNYRA